MANVKSLVMYSGRISQILDTDTLIVGSGITSPTGVDLTITPGGNFVDIPMNKHLRAADWILTGTGIGSSNPSGTLTVGNENSTTVNVGTNAATTTVNIGTNIGVAGSITIGGTGSKTTIGGDLQVNGNELVLGGSIFTGTTTFKENVNFGDGSGTDIVTLTSSARLMFDVAARTVGNIVPNASNTDNLGSATNRWANIYTVDLNVSDELTVENLTVTGNTILGDDYATDTLTVNASVKGNVVFEKEANHLVTVVPTTTPNAAGGGLQIEGGISDGSGTGGTVKLTGGRGGTTGAGGAVEVIGGLGGTTSGNGGSVTIRSGASGPNGGNSGSLTLETGNAFSNTGNISIRTGSGTTSGSVLIDVGAGMNQNGTIKIGSMSQTYLDIGAQIGGLIGVRTYTNIYPGTVNVGQIGTASNRYSDVYATTIHAADGNKTADFTTTGIVGYGASFGIGLAASTTGNGAPLTLAAGSTTVPNANGGDVSVVAGSGGSSGYGGNTIITANSGGSRDGQVNIGLSNTYGICLGSGTTLADASYIQVQNGWTLNVPSGASMLLDGNLNGSDVNATTVTGANLNTLTNGSNADGLHTHATGSVSVSGTSGEAIALGAPVAFDYDGSNNPRVYQAACDGGNGTGQTKDVVGISLTAATGSGQTVSVQVCGEASTPTGVWDSAPGATDVGKRVYLSANNGKLTLTPPNNSGDNVIRIGWVSAGGTNPKIIVSIGEGVVL